MLTETGRTRDGMPVLTRAPDGGGARDVLRRGFAARLVRLYGLEQTYLYRAGKSVPEPAYLLLSGTQGGFPRFGFYLDDEDKRHAGYVDLYHTQPPSGRFGAIDQIFPHELLHVIVRQLAGDPPDGGANQVHAIGVRTDPQTAFSEGFAEHAQIMAVDDEDGFPDTRALRANRALGRQVEQEQQAYARELSAAWAPAAPMRMRFLFWFNQNEQVLRYDAVKANLFAHAPEIPASLATRDRYAAYLLSNMRPGASDAPVKPARVALSTEGVVAHLFWRWVTSPGIQSRFRDEAFYQRFGTTPGQVTPLDNAYLKLFHTLFVERPHDAAAMIRAYGRVFPDEAPLVDAVVSETLAGQQVPMSPEIWLANPAFRTGTTLFDQFRALPRIHTFDINAAGVLDWVTVPGVSADLARRLAGGGPYASLDALRRVPGVDRALADRLAQMAAAMQRLRGAAGEGESSISVWSLLRPFLWRALIVFVVASAAATLLYRSVRGSGWLASVLAGLTASLMVTALSWVVVGPTWLPPVMAPVLCCGTVQAAWNALRGRRAVEVGSVLLAWLAACLPAGTLTRAWF